MSKIIFITYRVLEKSLKLEMSPILIFNFLLTCISFWHKKNKIYRFIKDKRSLWGEQI